ncbi:hypothetical protein GCM10009098_15970 [Rheinheimera aquimaris]|uniref:Uncharacterized protein n=1 Tax=Rheinheimera aquimaris TaxID=412437 RepID=A0ABN1DQR1_9GAMM|nr:hypothetical protein [Rheinheimera aquimaris]MCB5213440.1 hypothetical protein [Rheinheimera aquimaris]
MASRYFIIFMLVGLVTACVSTSNNNVASYDKNAGTVYPPVSFFITRPTAELNQQCLQFADDSVMQHCQINQFDASLYWQQLYGSGLFERVMFAGEGTDYQVLVSTANMSRETAADITKAAVAGATLMLLPVTNEFSVKAEVTVLWRDLVLKRFSYDVPFSHTMSLFHKPDGGAQHFAQTLMSYFLRDIEQQQVFSGAFLLSALQDSDYLQQLKAPAQLGDFQLAGQHIYNDPLAGTQLRYINQNFIDDYIDVFVYPIRRTDWQEPSLVMHDELENVRKELQLFYQQQNKIMKLQEAKTISWQHESGDFHGSYFELTIEDIESLPSSTYLFIAEDKFIKLRCTFGADHAESLVKALIPKIIVPDESLFMATLRQRFREQMQPSGRHSATNP